MTLTETPTSTSTATEGRWSADPFGRYEMRWWDGSTWTEHVSYGGKQMVDPLGTAPPAVPAPFPETGQGRTDRDSTGAFVGLLLVCALFPIASLVIGTRYLIRREYGRALASFAVAAAMMIFALAVLPAGGS